MKYKILLIFISWLFITTFNIYSANSSKLLASFDTGNDPFEASTNSSLSSYNISSIEYTSSNTFNNSKYSVKINLDGGNDGGVLINFGTIDLSDYNAIRFWIKGEYNGINFRVNIEDTGGGPGFRPYISEFLDAGITTSWQLVVIPFKSLARDEDTTVISKLFIDEEQWAGAVYIDEISVVKNVMPVWIDDFDDNNTTNSFNQSWSNWWGLTNSTVSSLYSNSDTYSLKIFTNGGDGGHYCPLDGMDISGGDTSQIKISYKIMGLVPSANVENIIVENPDAAEQKIKVVGNGSYIDGSDTIDTSQWRTAEIKLTEPDWVDTAPPVEFDSIKWFALYLGGANDTIWIDDVKVYDYSSPAAPTNLKLNDNEVSSYDTIILENHIKVSASSGTDDATICNVIFEYSSDGGGTWKYIGSDYNLDDTEYICYWNTTGFNNSIMYSLRTKTEDVQGNQTIGSIYHNLFLDNQLPTVTVNLYSDSDMTTEANITNGNYVVSSGTYYIKLTFSEPLGSAPNYNIDFENGNDIYDSTTTMISSLVYRASLIISDNDTMLDGLSTLTVSCTDLGGNFVSGLIPTGSETININVLGADTVSLTSPLSGSITSNTCPEFIWTIPDTTNYSINYYEINFSTYQDFTDNYHTGTAATNSYNSVSLVGDTSYWRVRSIDELGINSEWSEISIIIIDLNPPTFPEFDTVSLAVNTYTNDTSLEFSFRGGTDTQSGFAGYSVTIETSPGISPDNTIEYQTGNTYGAMSISVSGTYYLNISSIDNAGNVSAPVSTGPFLIDLSSPSAITDLRVQSISDTEIQLSWSVPTDSVSGIKYYNIYRSTDVNYIGELITKSTEVSTGVFTDTGTTLKTTVHYTVYSEDQAGNISSESNKVGIPGKNSTDYKTTIVLDDFNSSETNKNLLNGSTGIFQESGSDSFFAYPFSGDDTIGYPFGYTGKSLIIGWILESGQYAGYYSNLNGIDLSDYDYLGFRIKGVFGNERIAIELGNGSQTSKIGISNLICDSMAIPSLTADSWIKVTIPLTAFINISDFSNMTGNFAVVIDKNTPYFSAPSGIIYIDDIIFGQNISQITVDSFEDSAGANGLNGSKAIYQGGSSVTINTEYSSDIYYHGSQSLKIEYDVNTANGDWIVWLEQLNDLDVSKSNNIHFAVKGSATGVGDTFNIYLKDSTNNRYKINSGDYITLTQNWQSVDIPISDFDDQLNEHDLIELQFVWEQNVTAGAIYIDDIMFTDNIFPDTPTMIKRNNNSLSDNTVFSNNNELSCYNTNYLNDYTLESILFEYSDKYGVTYILGRDYNTSDNIYEYDWTASDLNDNDTFNFRVSAEDNAGNISYSEFFLNCKKDITTPYMTSAQLLSETQIIVYWNEIIDTTTVQNSYFYIDDTNIVYTGDTNSNYIVTSINFSETDDNSKTVTELVLGNELYVNTVHKIFVISSIKDMVGNEAVSHSIYVYDSFPPEINDVDFINDKQIQIIFSELINIDTAYFLGDTIITIKNSNNSINLRNINFNYNPVLTLTWTTTQFNQNDSITIIINDIYDMSGNHTDTIIFFKTITSFNDIYDTIPPEIESILIADMDSQYIPGDIINIEINTYERGLTIVPNFGYVDSEYDTNNSNDNLNINEIEYGKYRITYMINTESINDGLVDVPVKVYDSNNNVSEVTIHGINVMTNLIYYDTGGILTSNNGAFINIPSKSIPGFSNRYSITVYQNDKSGSEFISGTNYDNIYNPLLEYTDTFGNSLIRFFYPDNSEFNIPVKIGIPFEYSAVSEELQDRLSIFYYDNHSWIDIGGTIMKKSDGTIYSDTYGNEYIVAYVKHFSPYAIMIGKQVTQKIQDLTISPNPFSPNNDNINDILNISFNSIVADIANIKIRIFTVSGRLIRKPEIRKSGTNYTAYWDGKDEYGNVVPIGLYIIHINAYNEISGNSVVLMK